MAKDRAGKMWCPDCKEFRPHTTGHYDSQEERTELYGKTIGGARGLWRQLECVCGRKWNSVEVPEEFLLSLVAFKEQAEARSESFSRRAEHGWYDKYPEP